MKNGHPAMSMLGALVRSCIVSAAISSLLMDQHSTRIISASSCIASASSCIVFSARTRSCATRERGLLARGAPSAASSASHSRWAVGCERRGAAFCCEDIERWKQPGSVADEERLVPVQMKNV